MIKLLLILITFIYFSTANAQTQDTDTLLSSRLTHYIAQNPIERLYVHQDRDVYYAGETIWLKVYRVISAKAAAASGTAYVDIVNSKGEVVKGIRLSLKEGEIAGQIELPQELPAGNYRLRAHTLWMRNFSEKGYYWRDLTILNPTQKNEETKQTAAGPSIRFFPEGGDLVDGLPSKVAFEISGTEADSTSGYILSAAQDTVLSFHTSQPQRGSFLLTPRKGERLTAYIDGQKEAFALPDCQSRGFVMQTICHYNTERLMQTVRIAVSHNFAPGELPPCKIMVHQKGTVYAQYPIDPAKTEQVIEPTTGKFPPGVCTLTLVDKNGHAYCERLLFARYPSKAHWQLRAQCTPDDLEKKVTVTIEPDKSGMLANGSFSMAMVQEGLDHTDSRYNFETYHYLGGELQGSAVPLDGLWTMNTTRDTQGIDLILLTRGWRRYSIEETARPHPDTDFPMEAGLSISGRVGGRVSKDDIPTVEVQTILRNGIHQDIYTCPIDSNKRFKLSGLSFDGIRDALISANTGSGKELPLELDKPEPPYRAAPDSSAVRLHRQEVDKWKEDSLAIASMKDPDIFDNVFVDEVKVTAKKADPLDGRRAYSKEFVQSSYSPPEGKVAGDLRSLLSRVPGVRMLPNKNTNGRYDPRRLAHISGFPEGTFATFVVDGRVYDSGSVESVYSLEAAAIERIEVLRQTNTVFGGFNNSGGVIAVYTRPVRGETVDPKHIVHQWLGYNQTKEFYTPIPTDRGFFDTPRRRHTVYWNPSVKTDKHGRATLTFYVNAAESGRYTLHCEGYSGSGIIAAKAIEVVVE